VGVDTYLYLLDDRRYDQVVTVLDPLIAGGGAGAARTMFDQACDTLTDAHRHRKFPWAPLHGTLGRKEEFQTGVALLDGTMPAIYNGERGRTLERWADEDYAIRDPQKVREYHLRDEVCGVIKRIAPPGSKLWANENYSNLYLLLHHATVAANFRALASYHRTSFEELHAIRRSVTVPSDPARRLGAEPQPAPHGRLGLVRQVAARSHPSLAP